MSDLGDDFRSHREARRRARESWWLCDCSRKVPPGEHCPDCGRNEHGDVKEEPRA